MDPATIAALLGGVMSMFGGGQPEYQMTPEEAWRFRMAKQLFGEAKGRVPGAAPDERMALADAQAMTGEQAGQMQHGLFADSAGGYGSTAGGGGEGDMLTRLNDALLSQKAQINARMMSGFLQAKKQDMSNAIGMAQGGGGQWQQQPDLAGVLGELARSYAMTQGTKKAPAANQPGQPMQAGSMTDPVAPQVPGAPMPAPTGGTQTAMNYGQPTAAANPYGGAYKWWSS